MSTTPQAPSGATEQTMGNDNTVTVLPDGSAFAMLCSPLPAGHWLYAPRSEWDSERDEFAECPRPILTHAQRDAVVAAVRYAVRGATMCGKEADFDPDALVQNAVYALCGPSGKALPASLAPAPAALPLAEIERMDRAALLFTLTQWSE